VVFEAALHGVARAQGEEDLIIIYAKVVDENGTILPEDSSLISFSVEGDAELIGENPVKAEAGIASILVKAKGGKACVIKAQADGLQLGELKL
jgi:beta-galactosidase